MKRSVFLANCLVGAAWFPAVAYAQNAGTDAATGQGDIVVSARQRAEKLQEVPVSVTAFTEKQLRDAGVKRVEDFIHMTPNITFVNSQNPGTSFITIRGLTQNRNQPAPVAIVVDGVLQSSDREFAAGLLDINDIEVVRGPQGALYGRNATGGAIIINTKKPTNLTEGHVEAGAASGDDYYGEATLSGPVIRDKLLGRISVRVQNREGYYDNIVLHQKVDPLKDVIIQSRLVYNATDRLTFDFKANYNRTTAGALNLTYQPANLNADGVTLNTANPFDYSRGDANQVNRTFYANNIGISKRTIASASLRSAYEFDFATLSSVTAFTHVEEGFASDQYPYTATRDAMVNGVMVGDGVQSQWTSSDAISEEIRLTSRANQRLRWMVGAYYVGNNHFISTSTSEDLGYGLVILEKVPQFNDPRIPTLSFLADDNHDRAWALFGNAEYDLTRRLELGVALRYDEDYRRQIVSPYNTAGSGGDVNNAHFGKLQPKFTLKYKALDNINLFTSWGQGFRSGQFNQNGVGAAAATIGLNGVSDVAKQEVTSSFEAGFKSSWLGNHLTVDGTYFHTAARNVQYFVFVSSISAQVLVNIDKVAINGGELEAALHFGGFRLDVGAGITDATIKAYSLSPTDVGRKAPFVPNKTVQVGAQYTMPVSGALNLTGRIDYELRGKQFWSPENETARKDLNLVNLRLTLADSKGRWEMAGFVKNLTDLKYNEEYGSGGFAYAANPRSYGMSLRYNY
ncbi:MAG TPA: TonB-dependent receptor [Novosphingobium sp.]|nr:TonB-dependent receptor [Novosphingobium sp.]